MSTFNFLIAMQKFHFLCFSFILCLSIISCNPSTSQYSLNLDYYENMSIESLCEIYPVNYMDLDEYRNASYAMKQDLEFEWGMKMGNYLIYRDYFNGKDGSSFKFDRSTRENASFAKMIFGIPTHIIYHEVYEPNITYKDFEDLYLEAYNMLRTKFKNTLNFEQLINPTNSTEADI